VLRIIICDDIKTNISTINQSIRNIISNMSISREIEIFSTNPDSLMNYKIKDNYTYLFILDVIYKNISGLDIAKKIRRQYKEVFIIFVTGHIELLCKVINQNIMPSGFISRPINENDMRKILFNVFDYYKESGKTMIQTLTINIGSNVYRIPFNEIIYIESLNKKILIYSDTIRISCYNSLQMLEKELGSSFIRCHKSFIINKKRIKNILFTEMIIEMDNGSKISMSRTYKNEVKKLVQEGDNNER